MKDPIHDLMHLDLAKLNWIGWLLLLGTVGIFVLACFLTVPLMRAAPGHPTGRSSGNKFLAVLVFTLSACFFFGCRWILARLGISIHRREKE